MKSTGARERTRAAAVARPPGRAVAGIDGKTGLASDFLNQFNEAVMLLDLVAGGDEALLDELDSWRPRDYAAYFGTTGNADSSMILDGYRTTHAPLRRRLDALSAESSALMLAGIVFLMSCRSAGHAVAEPAARLAAELRRRLDLLDGIVHAGARRPSQAEVSALFRSRAA